MKASVTRTSGGYRGSKAVQMHSPLVASKSNLRLVCSLKPYTSKAKTVTLNAIPHNE